jgi:hypothetical protein
MARETAAQKKTRIGMLLADYDARSRELRKLLKDVDALKVQVREVPAGTYGEWTRSEGTPREIVDQAAVKREYVERGEIMPMKMTEAPIIVTHRTP